MALLTVDRLTRCFGGLTALSAVSFEVDRGEIVGLVGPNGAGKTTCFNVMTGFIPATSGKVFFKEKDITRQPPYRISGHGIARTFQITSIFPDSTVLQNVLMGFHLKLETNLLWQAARSIFRVDGFYDREAWAVSKAMETLEALGLNKQCNELAKNLPLVDQRKLEICIALAAGPELLLLDEPAAGVPPQEVGQLIRELGVLHAQGMTIILVDHNMKFVMNLCQRIVVLHHGAKIAEGAPVEIVNNPEVRRVYLAQ